MASWSVQVRPIRDTSGENFRLLGDVDESNTGIWPYAAGALRTVNEEDDKGRPVTVHSRDASAPHPEALAAWFEKTTYDVPGRITDQGRQVFDRRVHHGTGVDQLALLHLPAGWDLGLLTICTRERAVAKNAIRDALNTVVREQFGLIAEVKAVVPAEMLREAIDRNRIMRVQFIADDKLKGRFGDVGEFGDDNTIGKVATEIVPVRRDRFLLGRRFRRFLDGDTAGVVRFNGVDYDRVRLTVKLANGAERTMTLGDDLSAAHPIWIDLENVEGDAGDELVDLVHARVAETAPAGWPF